MIVICLWLTATTTAFYYWTLRHYSCSRWPNSDLLATCSVLSSSEWNAVCRHWWVWAGRVSVFTVKHRMTRHRWTVQWHFAFYITLLLLFIDLIMIAFVIFIARGDALLYLCSFGIYFVYFICFTVCPFVIKLYFVKKCIRFHYCKKYNWTVPLRQWKMIVSAHHHCRITVLSLCDDLHTSKSHS